MSVIRVQKLVALSDNDFNIEMPPTAILNVTGNLAQDQNSALKLPAGTTAQRPSPPSAGQVRFNTDDETVEGYNGSEWVNLMVAETTTVGASSAVPERGLIMHMDANNPNSLKPNASDQDANYWYNLRQNNLHFAIPSDRISQESINGQVVKYLDFSVNGAGCAKLVSAGNYIDSPWYPHCSVVFFLKWRNSNSQWRTPLRSRDNDHHIIVQDGNRNLGMYDNNGTGFNDTGYDINQFPDWDTKFNMYTWRFSSYESGTYSPNYQCFFKDENTARATINNSNSRFNRGFHHVGAWGNSSRNPHTSSQNCGSFPVFMYYNRHITQAERAQIYNAYKDTFNI
tara:strand:+ start:1906 stop:2925 length:1020 start_codon:yes stop_codon:yes gene_type:complete